MADCVSLPSVRELAVMLRDDARWCHAMECGLNIPSDAERNIHMAADMLEQMVTKCDRLIAENLALQQTVDVLTEETIRLRADRDAAAEELRVQNKGGTV